eukprot:scaffold36916_cov183-Amphora_coffeaeformis.AAC.1
MGWKYDIFEWYGQKNFVGRNPIKQVVTRQRRILLLHHPNPPFGCPIELYDTSRRMQVATR